MLAMEDILGVAEEIIGRNSHYAAMNNAASMVWCCQGDFAARCEGESDFEFAYIQARKSSRDFRLACDRLEGAIDERCDMLCAMM